MSNNTVPFLLFLGFTAGALYYTGVVEIICIAGLVTSEILYLK